MEHDTNTKQGQCRQHESCTNPSGDRHQRDASYRPSNERQLADVGAETTEMDREHDCAEVASNKVQCKSGERGRRQNRKDAPRSKQGLAASQNLFGGTYGNFRTSRNSPSEQEKVRFPGAEIFLPPPS